VQPIVKAKMNEESTERATELTNKTITLTAHPPQNRPDGNVKPACVEAANYYSPFALGGLAMYSGTAANKYALACLSKIKIGRAPV